MIKFKHKGNLKKTTNFLKKASKFDHMSVLNNYGRRGVAALASATPTDTGETALSWYYKLRSENGKYYIEWHNSNVVTGVVIAVILQYGHATSSGGYVQGIDYINPALSPVFENVINDVWREIING